MSGAEVRRILCAHADRNGEGAHWKNEGDACVEGIRPDQCDHSSTGGRCDVCGVVQDPGERGYCYASGGAGSAPASCPTSTKDGTRGSALRPDAAVTGGEVRRLCQQIADELATALAEAGISQADLAREMGLSAKHVNHMVNGKSGALGMYDFAAHVLGRRWTVTLAHLDGGASR